MQLHTALMEPLASGLCNRLTGKAYHRKDQEKLNKATTKPRSIIHYHWKTAALTGSDATSGTPSCLAHVIVGSFFDVSVIHDGH
jgi:hypothetical protein